jgi:hypothetical protein
MPAGAAPVPTARYAAAAFALAISLPGATARPASLEKALVLAGMEGRALDRARTQAAALLEGDGCRKVFSEFRDAEGRTLQEKLDAVGQTPAEYLGSVIFLNGEVQLLCRRSSVQMVTTGKSRYVYVCPQFRQFEDRNRELAPVLVIHEALHTLGLGEAPQKGAPTSIEITRRVEARCR